MSKKAAGGSGTVASAHQVAFYPESSFGGFSDIDGTVVFYGRVNALVNSTMRVLDFGCGRGSRSEDPVSFRRELTSLRGKAGHVLGLDVSAAGQDNPFIDEFVPLIPNTAWPVDSKSIDLIVCDCVIEHLPDPDAFFAEARRVLTVGGFLCIRTPNALSYVGLASRLIPNRHHAKVLSKVQTDRHEEDVFPTLYRCNTVAALRRQMTRHGFTAAVYGYEAEPGYLSFSRIAYSFGVLHQKLAPGFLRPVIFAFGSAGPA